MPAGCGLTTAWKSTKVRLVLDTNLASLHDQCLTSSSQTRQLDAIAVYNAVHHLSRTWRAASPTGTGYVKG